MSKLNIKSIFKRFSRSSYWVDVGWLVSGNTFAQLIGILIMPIITRLYSPSDLAIQNVFIQILGFTVVIITWRYEYFIQLPKDNHQAISLLHLIIKLGIFGCLTITPIMWFLRDNIEKWLGVPNMALWLMYAPVTAFLISISIALSHLAQRNQQYRISGFSEITNKLTYAGSALLGYWILLPPAGLMIAPGIGAIGKSVVLTWLLKRKNLLPLRKNIHSISNNVNNKEGINEIINKYSNLSISMVVSHILLSTTTIIPTIFIAHTYGKVALGQYALVMSTIFLPSGLIGAAIGQVYYQRAAACWAKGENFIDLWYKTAKKLIVFGMPAYIIIGFFAPKIYPIVFGHAWVDAGRFAVLLSISSFFSFITSPLDRTCIVVGASWYIPVWHLARTITVIIVVLLSLVYKFVLIEFIFALVVQMVVMYIVDYLYEWRFACRVKLIL